MADADEPWRYERPTVFPVGEWDLYMANRERLWRAGIRHPVVLARVGFDTEATRGLLDDIARLRTER